MDSFTNDCSAGDDTTCQDMYNGNPETTCCMKIGLVEMHLATSGDDAEDASYKE